VRLVAVPLLPLGMIAPNLQAAASATPEQIIGERRQMLTAQELKRCEDVLRRLTPRQRQVVQAFAHEGATVDGVARAFHVTEATLNTHKTRIFEECRIAWGLPQDEKLTHYFLREAFGGLSAEVWQRWV
jgi:DNA-directed RNA polymerase specialized sigma24 family protein